VSAFDLDIKLKAVITDVSAKVQDAERRIQLTLEREFDTELANALNAVPVMDLVVDGKVDSAVMAIDAVLAIGVLKAGKEKVKIPELAGVRVKAKKGKEVEDGPNEPPRAVLVFECKYNRDVWVFLGEALDAIAEIKISSVQPPLKLKEGEQQAPKKARKKKGAVDERQEALPS